jgi:hypothetical protein
VQKTSPVFLDHVLKGWVPPFQSTLRRIVRTVISNYSSAFMVEHFLIEPARVLRWAGNVELGSRASSFTLETDENESTVAEIVLDYQQCEGGLPIFEIERTSGDGPIKVSIIYSEAVEGIDHDTGRVKLHIT